MELKQIKQNIFYILSIIGTSFGVIGTAVWGLILGIRHWDLVTIWGSAIGIGITLFGLGIWTANLIIEANKYFKQKGVENNGSKRNPKDTRPQ